MSQRLPNPAPRTHGLALDMKPGDDHYRAYVGPPRDYDLVAAMVFNLLTCTGLRQHHRLLDIGCGSLRVGRLLIPYLNASHYIGVEPNRWLVEDGIANEIGLDQVQIKQPRFSFRDSLDEFQVPLEADVAVAQSIFSHCAEDLLRRWLEQLSTHLADNGALFATFLVSDQDFTGSGWIYPGCVKYRPETIAMWAADCGFSFRMLDWYHPRQQWALFSKPGYNTSLVDDGPIAWNRFASQASR